MIGTLFTNPPKHLIEIMLKLFWWLYNLKMDKFKKRYGNATGMNQECQRY